MVYLATKTRFSFGPLVAHLQRVRIITGLFLYFNYLVSVTAGGHERCHGRFHLELSGMRVERELQNEKFLSTVGFEPGAFGLRSKGATTELRRLMSVEWIKVHLV